jgi:predicted O-linked N-acetylglucosamine transferase (SPINDLY family)
MASAPDFRSIVDLQIAGHLLPAEAALRAWIAAYPGHAEAQARLGMVLQARGLPAAALPFLQAAARLEPGNPQAACLVGAACHALGRLDEAAASYRRAIAIAPRMERAYNNLGLVLGEQGDPAAAEAVFRAVLAFMPDYATALANLGALLVAGGRDGEARAPLQRALRLRQDDGGTLLQLAGCLERSGEFDQAIRLLQAGSAQADSAQPGAGSALRMALARLLAAANRAPQARAVYAQVAADQPTNLKARIGACLTLPLVYGSRDELDAERRRFEQGMATLETVQGDIVAPLAGAASLLADLAWVNFPLAYQGLDDSALQARYGQWLTRVLRQALPAWIADRPPRKQAGTRVRIGFVASLFHRSTVCGYFSSWVTGLDPARFEVFVYHAGVREDAATRALAATAAHYLHLPLRDGAAMLGLAQRIDADALDILVYPELGMTAELFPLAALRLAPVQCAGWGHPVTTGLPNIDHYFSSGPMEPPDAQAHYSEHLILLPGLGTRYARPAVPPPATREDVGLPPGRRLILFPHAPFKIHPDNDALLAEIAARDDDVLFVLVQDRQPALARAVLARLERALVSRGCAPGRHLLMLPYLRHDDYLRLNGVCDLMLDCLHWSGGNTTLDAIACGLPVATLPGASMRSRQSAAMLRMAGLDTLVAADAGAYVDTALRLAQDVAYREAIRTRLRAGAAAVFAQAAPLQSLQCKIHEIIWYANGMQK